MKLIKSRVGIKMLAYSTQEDGLPYDLAEHRIHLVPTFSRSQPLIFLSLGLHERLNQEKIPATISQMNEQVKEIIESIPAEILQRVIGELSRRIRNSIVTRRVLF